MMNPDSLASFRPHARELLAVTAVAATLGCGGSVTDDHEAAAAAGSAPPASTSSGACPTTVWGRGFADTFDYEYGEGVAVDAACNVVVAGNFGGTIDFGGSKLSGDAEDVFVAKLDGEGHALWSKSFGLEPFQGSAYVAVDGAGNIALAGTFGGTIGFGTDVLHASQEAIYVAELDPRGEPLWSRAFGASFESVASAVTADASGSVIVAGYFIGEIDFGAGPVGSSEGRYAYVAKIDRRGATQWARAFDSYAGRAAAVAVDAQGDVLVTGEFSDTMTLDSFVLEDEGDVGTFVAKLDGRSGAVATARAFPGTGSREAAGITVDPAGNAWVLGSFNQGVDWGEGLVQTAGYWDGFLVALDPEGDVRWGKTFGGPASDSIYAVAADREGNAWVTGAFTAQIDFGGGVLWSAGSEDGFVASFDANGAHRSSRALGGPSGGGDAGMSIAVDPSGNALVTGVYQGAADFGSGPVASAGGMDVFVAKLVP